MAINKTSLIVGIAVGVLMSAVSGFAQRGVFSVADILGDPGKYYGRSLSVEGIAGPVRFSRKIVDYKTRQEVEFVSFELYVPDAKGYKGRGRHNVYVNIPASGFGMNRPAEGGSITVTGNLTAPYQIGRIE